MAFTIDNDIVLPSPLSTSGREVADVAQLSGPQRTYRSLNTITAQKIGCIISDLAPSGIFASGGAYDNEDRRWRTKTEPYLGWAAADTEAIPWLWFGWSGSLSAWELTLYNDSSGDSAILDLAAAGGAGKSGAWLGFTGAAVQWDDSSPYQTWRLKETTITGTPSAADQVYSFALVPDISTNTVPTVQGGYGGGATSGLAPLDIAQTVGGETGMHTFALALANGLAVDAYERRLGQIVTMGLEAPTYSSGRHAIGRHIVPIGCTEATFWAYVRKGEPDASVDLYINDNLADTVSIDVSVDQWGELTVGGLTPGQPVKWEVRCDSEQLDTVCGWWKDAVY